MQGGIVVGCFRCSEWQTCMFCVFRQLLMLVNRSLEVCRQLPKESIAQTLATFFLKRAHSFVSEVLVALGVCSWDSDIGSNLLQVQSAAA